MDRGSRAEGVLGGLGGRACMGPAGTVTETVPPHTRDEALQRLASERCCRLPRAGRSRAPDRAGDPAPSHGAGGVLQAVSDHGSRSCAWSPAGVPALVLRGPRAASWGQVQPCGRPRVRCSPVSGPSWSRGRNDRPSGFLMNYFGGNSQPPQPRPPGLRTPRGRQRGVCSGARLCLLCFRLSAWILMRLLFH